MTNWTYANGRIEARDDTGVVLLAISAEPVFAALADLFSANQRLSRLILEGHGTIVAPMNTAPLVFGQLSEVVRKYAGYASKGVHREVPSEYVTFRVYSENQMATETSRAAVLSSGQIRHLLAVTEATSRHPERDAVVLLLGLSCGMRITEIAQITVADLMFPSGKLRTEVSLRAAITKGCKQRCVYMSSPKLLAALEHYLSYRLEHGIGTELEPAKARYRGLLPNLPLLMTRRGAAFLLNIKRRVLETGELAEYWAADSLQSYVTKLYKNAGIKGGSSHSGRRTFATRLYTKTRDMEAVRLLLGHDDADCTMRYIDVDKRILRQAFIDVI